MAAVNTLFGTIAPISGPTNMANGYLILRLSVDSIVNSTTLVCSGYQIQINLDSNGAIIPSQPIWPNDAMTPNTAGYHVSAYTAGGQLVWGPNLCSILSSPSPFNISGWIPS